MKWWKLYRRISGRWEFFGWEYEKDVDERLIAVAAQYRVVNLPYDFLATLPQSKLLTQQDFKALWDKAEWVEEYED